jgi:Putative Flp pilus-assembly TadE/G-like
MSDLVFMLVVLLPLLGLGGLAIDGGQVLVERRAIQGIADGAARAGAAELDEASARQDTTLPPELDRDAAWDAAAQYIAVQPPGLEAHIDTSPDAVRVHLTSRPIPMSFLRLAGITTVRVEADAHAEPETGVVEPEAP